MSSCGQAKVLRTSQRLVSLFLHTHTFSARDCRMTSGLNTPIFWYMTSRL